MTLGEGLAQIRVRAALGRPPQDALEAAVVLESWGLPPAAALGVARPDGPQAPPRALEAWTRLAAEPAQRGDGLGLAIGLVAAAVWVVPLVALLSRTAVDAWRWALPVTFFLQWALRRRYLAHPDADPRARLGSLRQGRLGTLVWALAGALAVSTLIWALPAGAVLAMVAVWTGGLLLVQRGWTLAYLALLGGGSAALALGAPVLADVAGEVSGVLILVGLAVATSRPNTRWPRPWRETLTCGLVGAAVALLIVQFRFPANAGGLELWTVAMVPSLLGGLVGFWWLGGLWPALGLKLARMAVGGRGRERLAAIARGRSATALVAYIVVAVGLSAAGLATLAPLGLTRGDALTVFANLDVIGLASAALAWMVALGRHGLALATAAVALCAGIAAGHLGVAPLATDPQLAGAGVAAGLAGALLWWTQREPDRLLAELR